MKKTSKLMAALLAGILIAGSAIPAYAAEPASAKEEVVYIITDANGNVQNINIVNIFSAGDITDYGNYSSVKMLTTTDTIYQNGDKISFSSSDSKIYYQGTMKQTEIPWNIELSYFLDGKKVEASEVAGKSGALEIRFSILRNTKCAGDFFEDYALQATLTLDTERCKNITANGATIANVGSDKQLSYTVLPGKGLDTQIKADVTDFEMAAISINGIKLNLNVEIDDAELMDKVAQIMEATEKLNNGANELYNGTDSLKDGSNTLNNGVSNLHSGISKLDSGIASLADGIGTAGSGLDMLNSKSSTLKDGSAQVLSALKTIQSSLNAVSMTADDLQTLISASGAIKDGIGKLYDGVTLLEQNLGYAQYKAVMAQNGVDINALKTGNEQTVQELTNQITSLQTTLTQIQSIPGYEAQAAALQEQIGSLQSVIQLLVGNNAAIGETEQYLNTMSDAVSELKSGISELKTNYEAFDTAIYELVGTLSNLTLKMSELLGGINQLVAKYTELDSGIGEYTDGVAQLVAGYSQIVTGVSSLASGSKELLNGSDSLKSGTAELLNGVTELCDGAAEMFDGTNEFYNQTKDMDIQIQEQIDGLLGSIQGEETETVSFVSDKNTDVESVQFVIKTTAIEKAEEVVPITEEEKPLNFWQKLLRLFGLY